MIPFEHPSRGIEGDLLSKPDIIDYANQNRNRQRNFFWTAPIDLANSSLENFKESMLDVQTYNNKFKSDLFINLKVEDFLKVTEYPPSEQCKLTNPLGLELRKSRRNIEPDQKKEEEVFLDTSLRNP